MSNHPLVPSAEGALQRFKEEVAKELGIADMDQARSVTNEPAFVDQQVHRGGNIGGQMVKKMIENAEREMAEK